jgi:Ca-activated chloride channel family protein
LIGLVALIAAAGCERTPGSTAQMGAPGTGSTQIAAEPPFDSTLQNVARNKEAPRVGVNAPVLEPNTERYPDADPNPVKQVAVEPVSTFSIDVDTAAYANVRRFLRDGQMPPQEAVRPEEMVNYFDYDYPLPEDRAAPFSTTVSVMPTPWNPDTRLLRIGLKGYDVIPAARPRANLVFLVDVSGSMAEPNKLPLVQQSLRLLVKELRDDDTVGIVTYAGHAGVALEPTPGRERQKILAVIDSLGAGGSTAGAQGLVDAYALAERDFDVSSVNRVILATDGDFNVGVTDPKALEDLIVEKRKTGIYLSVLGFGMGNLNDLLMQKIAQAGNGNAAYIDSLMEGRKVLVDEMASTLFPIANDVKIQVEFNPAQVAEYRLIGYETRALRREDFNNDAIDAGEIGSGHTVTALYEIVPPKSKAQLVDPLRYGTTIEPVQTTTPFADEIAFLRLRYKLPGESDSRLIERPITVADSYDRIEAAPEDMRFAAAVAGFAQLLRGDPYLKAFGHDDIAALAQDARGDDPFGYRAEFVQLVRMSETAQQAAAQ